MQTPLLANNGGVRISIAASPRRSAAVTHVNSSPVKSVTPEHHTASSMHLQSIESEADMATHTADFFDDDSGDDEAPTIVGQAIGPESDARGRSGSPNRRALAPHNVPFPSQCETRRATYPNGAQGYQPLNTLPYLTDDLRVADTANSSFAGSVDELLPGEHEHEPESVGDPSQAQGYLSNRLQAPGYPQRALLSSERAPRSPGLSNTERNSRAFSVKAEHNLQAHAIAHEIALQALMRDEEVTEHGLPWFTSYDPSIRRSALPPSLRVFDPRSPREQFLGLNLDKSRASKKVQVVPPPIDTSASRRSIPDDIIRTPYPFTDQSNGRHKDVRNDTPMSNVTTRTASESVLRLSVRGRSRVGLARVEHLVIPASNDFSAVRSSHDGAKEQHFQALTFDDRELFRQLRQRYAKLTGIGRFLSARSLARIAVDESAYDAVGAENRMRHQPRSQRNMTHHGLADPLSEKAILQHFLNPDLGRTRYAFVEWAHRLAAGTSTPVHTPQGQGDEMQEQVHRDMTKKMEQHYGLEFIFTWSVRRIVAALALVFLLSIAATLLWTFLGKNTVQGSPPVGGFLDAGDRVGTGILIGICVLLLGISGIAGWLGVSWLVV